MGLKITLLLLELLLWRDSKIKFELDLGPEKNQRIKEWGNSDVGEYLTLRWIRSAKWLYIEVDQGCLKGYSEVDQFC